MDPALLRSELKDRVAIGDEYGDGMAGDDATGGTMDDNGVRFQDSGAEDIRDSDRPSGVIDGSGPASGGSDLSELDAGWTRGVSTTTGEARCVGLLLSHILIPLVRLILHFKFGETGGL